MKNKMIKDCFICLMLLNTLALSGCSFDLSKFSLGGSSTSSQTSSRQPSTPKEEVEDVVINCISSIRNMDEQELNKYTDDEKIHKIFKNYSGFLGSSDPHKNTYLTDQMDYDSIEYFRTVCSYIQKNAKPYSIEDVEFPSDDTAIVTIQFSILLYEDFMSQFTTWGDGLSQDEALAIYNSYSLLYPELTQCVNDWSQLFLRAAFDRLEPVWGTEECQFELAKENGTWKILKATNPSAFYDMFNGGMYKYNISQMTTEEVEEFKRENNIE